MAPPTMDSLISLRVVDDVAIGGGQEYEDHIRHTIKVLGSFSEGDLAAAADAGLLNTLDAVLDALPYAYLLQAKVKQASAGKQLTVDLHPGRGLWRTLAAFLEHANPVEMRYIGHAWSFLMEVLCSSIHYPVADSMTAAAAVAAAVRALLRLDPQSCTLTMHHLALARLALLKNASRDCLPLLSHDIMHLPSKAPVNPDQQLRSDLPCPSNFYISRDSGFTSKLSLVHAQEYFTLSALNYIAVQDWPHAAFCLERVLVTPCSNNPNGVMVEAYKKWLLVSLLAKGRSQALTPAVSEKTAKTLRGAAKPYESLGEAFIRTDYRKLVAEVEEGTSVWTDDHNVGLVQRLLADHQRRAVSRLGKTYATLPMHKVASLMQMDVQAAAQYLGRLIQSGALNARLVQAQGGAAVLSFLNDGVVEAQGRAEVELRVAIAEQTRRLQTLEEEIRTADHALSMTKPYLDSVKRARSRKADASLGGEEPNEIFAPGESEDEDVMAET